MFNSPIAFRFVQKRRNKGSEESFLDEYIYVFRVRNHSSIKYVVNIKDYGDNILTIEFYPKIASPDKYKALTNQYKFGQVGSTILEIMLYIQVSLGISCFGILAASLLGEIDNELNKRFVVYTEILRRKVDETLYSVLGVQENSYIFVIPNVRLIDSNNLILRYEQIFKETQ